MDAATFLIAESELGGGKKKRMKERKKERKKNKKRPKWF